MIIFLERQIFVREDFTHSVSFLAVPHIYQHSATVSLLIHTLALPEIHLRQTTLCLRLNGNTFITFASLTSFACLHAVTLLFVTYIISIRAVFGNRKTCTMHDIMYK